MFIVKGLKRSYFEAISIVVILIFAIISIMPSANHNAYLKLNHGKLIYSGGMIDNKFSGEGKLIFKNHDYYVGNFKNGEFDGSGKFVSHEKWILTGNFEKGEPNGNEKMSNKGKNFFNGVVKDGSLTYAN